MSTLTFLADMSTISKTSSARTAVITFERAAVLHLQHAHIFDEQS